MLTSRICRKNVRTRRGAALVETLLCFFILFLVLFGMIHVSYFFIGQYFADYAALRGARSRTVGFAPYLVNRESKINAIGGSGFLVSPSLSGFHSENPRYAASQFQSEKTLIQRYMVGARYLEYEYWNGRSPRNPSLRTTFHTVISPGGSNTCKVSAYFDDYASVERYIGKMFFNGGIRLHGEAVLRDHSQVYLD